MSFGFKSHAFLCEPKCGNAIRVGSYKCGQTHHGPISTRSHNTNKWGGVGGHFGMQQGEIYKKNFMVCALDNIKTILGNIF